ncbi:MAG: C1 family peptidase [Tannerellaceae bacterium]|jgi:bleomycin hydrolase|nr:C1 family peptidase [Tannerellaceae bacterium]
MRTRIIIICLIALAGTEAWAQDYQFTEVKRIEATPVKNQASTGTCWSFATTSFMESELLRRGKGTYDLSEMFIVRQKYINQLEDNYIRRGKGNIGQGSLAHTFKNAFRQAGIVPEEVYNGINYDSDRHDHREMSRYIHAIAEVAVNAKHRSPEYYKLVESLLDTYLGKLPATFTYKGKEYTPKSFAASLELNMDDYIELTSFTHHPYYTKFDIEVPDNWEHQLMYNLPLDELMESVNHALNSGYTVCWDGDVSDKGFTFDKGVATLPEANITPGMRQEGYEDFTTTDDHLMHITGIAKDQNGVTYYITKNSWGTERNTYGGYLNMSESYVRAKTIYVMVHKDAIPRAIRNKLGI